MECAQLASMAKPDKQEIESFYKKWWLENFIIPLNKTPMGLTDFISAFYDQYCTESADK